MNKLLVPLLAGASLFVVPAFAASDAPADPAAPAPPASSPSKESNSSITAAEAIGRTVVDTKGKKVGEVKDARIDSMGDTELIVDVGSKDVAMPSTEFIVASNDQLQTNKSASEIKKLPPAPSAASPNGASPSPGAGGASPDSDEAAPGSLPDSPY